MDTTTDLRLLLASRHALLIAQMRDEERFMAILRDAARLAGFAVWTWSATQGLARDGHSPQIGTPDAAKALEFVRALDDPAVFVLHDLAPVMEQNTVVIRALKEIALRIRRGRLSQTIVITGPTADVPASLEGTALPWRLDPPTRAELEAFVRRFAADLGARGFTVALDDAGIRGLVDAVTGLTLPEAERLILRATIGDGGLGDGDVAEVREAKAELLASDGILELIATDERGLETVGGLDELKAWLAERGRGFESGAREFGLEPPRGVLLTGVPGCGKSLVAKTLARSWGMPLVLFDPARIYDKYVGETEARLRSVLATIEAMAPIVVWVDEIEKGLSVEGEGGGTGTGRRALGTFLRWIQDRGPGVFLVATSNDVDSLPPELLRRGRFDEIFFVDLPSSTEREHIVRLHLQRRGRDPMGFDLPKLAASSDGFSGAELEAAIVAALYAAYAVGGGLTTEGLIEEFTQTIPLSRTRAEDVAAMRAWAMGRATPATSAGAVA
ncbi:MAG: AAA family ATPase [Actinomycetota bacterium]